MNKKPKVKWLIENEDLAFGETKHYRLVVIPNLLDEDAPERERAQSDTWFCWFIFHTKRGYVDYGQYTLNVHDAMREAEKDLIWNIRRRKLDKAQKNN